MKGSRGCVVKAFMLILPIAAMGCSRASARPAPASSSSSPTTTSRPTPARLTATAAGEPFGLRADGGTISFCDQRGGRKLEAVTGKDSAFTRPCPKDGEANAACDGLGLDVAVRTPNLGPDDVVDVNGSSFPLNGRVHDCAANGNVLAIVTLASVVLIDTKKNTTEVIERDGGDRIAIGAEWVAWSNGSTIHARQR